MRSNRTPRIYLKIFYCCDTCYLLLKKSIFVQHNRKNGHDYHSTDSIKLKNGACYKFQSYIFQIVDDVIIQIKFFTRLHTKKQFYILFDGHNGSYDFVLFYSAKIG